MPDKFIYSFIIQYMSNNKNNKLKRYAEIFTVGDSISNVG